MTEQERFKQNQSQPAHKIYSEVIIRKTTYCVTSVFADNLNVAQVLEDLAISEIICRVNSNKTQNVNEG